MSDPALIERIRSIFLHDEPRVTLAGAARLLGRSHDDITAAIDEGDIETIATGGGPMIDIREIAEQAIHVWPLVTIEEALGADASLILRWRAHSQVLCAPSAVHHRSAAAPRGGERGERRSASHARVARLGAREQRPARGGDPRLRRGD